MLRSLCVLLEAQVRLAQWALLKGARMATLAAAAAASPRLAHLAQLSCAAPDPLPRRPGRCPACCPPPCARCSAAFTPPCTAGERTILSSCARAAAVASQRRCMRQWGGWHRTACLVARLPPPPLSALTSSGVASPPPLHNPAALQVPSPAGGPARLGHPRVRASPPVHACTPPDPCRGPFPTCEPSLASPACPQVVCQAAGRRSAGPERRRLRRRWLVRRVRGPASGLLPAAGGTVRGLSPLAGCSDGGGLPGGVWAPAAQGRPP